MSGSGSVAAIGLDALAVGLVVAAALIGAAHPSLMLAWVVTVVALRTLLWSKLPLCARRHSTGAEVAVVAGLAVLGGFNDWLSVAVHHVYSYRVPSDLAPWSPIPLWMWVFWGLVLRAVVSVVASDRNAQPAATRTLEWVVALALVLATRRAIYRFHADPWLSWLPFAGALGIWGAVLAPDRSALARAGAVAGAGTVAEALLIRVGGLHHYELGWFCGVPLWIVLWWVLGALTLAEASALLRAGAAGRQPGGSASAR